MRVRRAEPRDDGALRDLLAAYGREFAYELGDQDLAAEARRARQTYAGLWVAEDGDVLVGCVALQDWGPGRCRMRRMFVPPAHRGRGVGRLLAEAVVAGAREAGYEVMVLDTSKPMQAARGLYRDLGFEPFEPDYTAPCREVEYLALRLNPPAA